jgi:hypothetical protein
VCCPGWREAVSLVGGVTPSTGLHDLLTTLAQASKQASKRLSEPGAGAEARPPTCWLCREEDRREREALRGRGRIRMLLTKGQVGAVMGRKGSTIK